MFAKIANLFKKDVLKEESSATEGQRFNDGVLLIEQNNEHREILVKATNHNALKMLGYANDEIVNHDLREFLSDSEVRDVNEFTEFKEGEKDLSEVLSKMRYFKMLKKNAEYLPLRLRVVRSISQENAPCFQLVFNDDLLRENIERKRDEYRKTMRGDEIFDDLTGLLTYDSVIKDIEILSFYEGKRENSSILVAFKLRGVEEGTDDVAAYRTCLAAAIEICKREEDISARVGSNELMLVLVETPETNIQIPIERVRSKFAELLMAKNVTTVPSLAVNYEKIEAEISAEKQVSALLS